MPQTMTASDVSPVRVRRAQAEVFTSTAAGKTSAGGRCECPSLHRDKLASSLTHLDLCKQKLTLLFVFHRTNRTARKRTEPNSPNFGSFLPTPPLFSAHTFIIHQKKLTEGCNQTLLRHDGICLSSTKPVDSTFDWSVDFNAKASPLRNA